MYADKKLIIIGRYSVNIKELIKNKSLEVYLSQSPFILLVIALTLLLTLPKAVSHGLGGDGQFYAVLARNLSEGIGSFWVPSFSGTLLSSFYEHPPLGIGIQSIFFKIFGNSYLVEKLYSVSTLLIIEFFVVLIWFRVFKFNDHLKSLFWLPVLLLLFIPSVTHTIGNNLLENTMGVFTIIAMYSLLRSIDTGFKLWWNIFGALMIVLAIITKGPVGSFLLVFYPIYMLSIRTIDLRTTIKATVVLIGSFALILGLLLMNDEAKNSLSIYFNSQVMGALKNGRGMAVNSHFYIIGELLKDLVPIFIFLALVYLYKVKSIKSNISKNYEVMKYVSLFLLIGISASIPSMISLKQNISYIVTCFPYFAIGFAILAAVVFDTNVKRDISTIGKTISVLSIVTVVGVLIFSFTSNDRVLKQENYYYDAKIFSSYISNEKIIGICPTPSFPWDIHSFFARYYRLSLDYSTPYQYKYFIGTSICAPPSNYKYKVVTSEFKHLKLFELIK